MKKTLTPANHASFTTAKGHTYSALETKPGQVTKVRDHEQDRTIARFENFADALEYLGYLAQTR
jgi:hypothetical protein